jgi:hypothetical protein
MGDPLRACLERSLERVAKGVKKPDMQNRWRTITLAGVLLISVAVGAQESKIVVQQRNSVYNLSRETVLQGTVVSFTEKSATPPIGAHVVVQTSSGAIDVHLGNASLLSQNNIKLNAGDSVRILGASVPYGETSFFAARILQKGSQSVALRNTNGLPLAPGRQGLRSAAPQGGAQ